jgi:hypothetical protein
VLRIGACGKRHRRLVGIRQEKFSDRKKFLASSNDFGIDARVSLSFGMTYLPKLGYRKTSDALECDIYIFRLMTDANGLRPLKRFAQLVKILLFDRYNSQVYLGRPGLEETPNNIVLRCGRAPRHPHLASTYHLPRWSGGAKRRNIYMILCRVPLPSCSTPPQWRPSK